MKKENVFGDCLLSIMTRINSMLYTYYTICSKDVRLPVQLQRAMAAEAEAAREARAKVKSEAV
jgi:hypothetical protein